MDDAGLAFHSGRLQKRKQETIQIKLQLKNYDYHSQNAIAWEKQWKNVCKNFRLLFQLHLHLPSYKKADNTLPQVQ